MTFILSLTYKKTSWIISSVFLVFLVIFYIFQVNALIGIAYRIAEQENTALTLETEKRMLEMQYIYSSSFQDIDNMAQVLEYEKIGKVVYLKASRGGVAQSGN